MSKVVTWNLGSKKGESFAPPAPATRSPAPPSIRRAKSQIVRKDSAPSDVAAFTKPKPPANPRTHRIIERDELMCALSADVAKLWRQQGASGGALHGQALLQQHVRQLGQWRRQSVGLHIEVQLLLASLWLKAGNGEDEARPGRETQEEKLDRVEAFWTQFREGGKRPELGVTLSGDGDSRLGPASPSGLGRRQAGLPLRKEKSFAEAVEQTYAPRRGRPAQLGELSQLEAGPDSGLPSPKSPAQWREHPLRSSGAAAPRGSRSTAILAQQVREAIHLGEERVLDGPRPPRSPLSLPASPTKGWSARAEQLGIPRPPPLSMPASPSKARHDRLPAPPVLAERPAPDLPTKRRRVASSLPPLGHSPQGSAPSQPRSDPLVWQPNSAPSRRYLRACEHFGLLPTATPFVTGHCARLIARDKVLVDSDMRAITMAIRGMTSLEEVDLQDCSVLSGASLVPFVEKLLSKHIVDTLQRLSLRRCLQMGQETLDAIVQLISPPRGACKLLHLDLSAIKMGIVKQVELCNAIAMHPGLTTVHLAEIGLGSNPAAAQCVDAVLSAPAIRELDIGWNCFSADVFMGIGQALIKHSKLVVLSLANTSAASNQAGQGGESPIDTFLEFLWADAKLTRLDISVNRLDFRGALVIEDALERNKVLEKLNVSDNPLGVPGMRCLLRLMLQSSSRLQGLLCDASDGGSVEAQGKPCHIFNPTNPGGRFTLELHRPYDRAILRMLCKTMERFGLSPDQAFTGNQCSPPPYRQPRKDASGRWCTPTSGTLVTTFSIEKSLQHSLQGMGEWDFLKLTRWHCATMRLRSSFRRMVPLMQMWEQLRGQEKEQFMLLDALSSDFSFEYPQVAELCSKGKLAGEVLRRVLPALGGGAPARFLALQCIPSVEEYAKLMSQLESYNTFCPDNPTGSYNLDLANPADRKVAQDLLLIDRWEAEARRGCLDTSQSADRSRFRNGMYEHGLLPPKWATEWQLPDRGMLQLDYSSTKRPPPDAAPMEPATFARVLRTLEGTPCSAQDCGRVLRALSDAFFCSCLQLRAVLNVLGDQDACLDAFVTFYFKLTDVYNEKLCRVWFQRPEDVLRLRKRLGHLALFPFIQPEESQLEFDFSMYDQRLAASVLMGLTVKENWCNLHNAFFSPTGGKVNSLERGVPPTWTELERMPSAGIFRVRYMCAPENRSMATRRNLLAQYGHWKVQVPEEVVDWWSASISDIPIDSLRLLEFLVTKFEDLRPIFHQLAFGGADAFLNFHEFEQGLCARLNFAKFQGPRQKERLQAVFRYMDPKLQGKISAEGWQVVEYVWKEVRQSLVELVGFLDSRHGSDLSAAWKKLDKNGLGKVLYNDWVQGLEDAGYLGPAQPLFAYLDADDDGAVSREELAEALRAVRQRGGLQGRRISAELSVVVAANPKTLLQRKTVGILKAAPTVALQ